MYPPLFDRNSLRLRPLGERQHDLTHSIVQRLDRDRPKPDTSLAAVAQALVRAKASQCASVMFMGGHVIRAGVQNYIIDLMERGYLTCLAMNGSGMIHDFEFALIGATTENVSRYIKTGEFGLWRETAYLNDIVREAYAEDAMAGMGMSVGKHIAQSFMPYRSLSIMAAAWRLQIPVTVHVGIGYDIIHEHPNCDGAATGALSYNDFLRMASVLSNLEGGVVMNFGSAVMAPEVYLKALSMARNGAAQQGKEIRHFTTLVCDLVDLPCPITSEPPKSCSHYYFRPLKTMLIRTVADGGTSYYVRGDHADTIPSLWAHVNEVGGAHG